MHEVTRVLSAIEQGDRHAAAHLLPLVYDELRKLAAQRMAHEKPGQTLDATALVHEAYLRLVSESKKDMEAGRQGDKEKSNAALPVSLSPALPASQADFLPVSPAPVWHSRGHFFAAAAEAMRRILIEAARRKSRQKRGGDCKRVDLDSNDFVSLAAPDELLIIDDAINRLATEDPAAAELVKLRYFAGLSVEEAAEHAGLSRSSAYEHWAYARAWLHYELYGSPKPPDQS